MLYRQSDSAKCHCPRCAVHVSWSSQWAKTSSSLASVSISQHLPQGKQLAECRPEPLVTSEALRILSGRPTLPLPQNSGSANSVPYTKPSRTSPVPVRSLGSGTETRVVLQSGSLPGDDSPHVGGPLQSPWSPSLQIKCTFYRKHLHPHLSQLMLVTSS